MVSPNASPAISYRATKSRSSGTPTVEPTVEMSLPPLSDVVSSQESLLEALSTLLEPSASLRDRLAPGLSQTLAARPSKPATYGELVDLAQEQLGAWDQDAKADFLGGHPRIGEVKNLSKLSSKEQSNATPTAPEVLAKLEVDFLRVLLQRAAQLKVATDPQCPV